MKTQAWGWLAAGVVAAALNVSYHQGGMPWAHEIADRVGHNVEAVVALASGNADQFLTEAQVVKAQNEISSCRLQEAMARVQSRIERSDERFEIMSAHEQERWSRLEANRDRIEARVASIRIPAIAVNPVVVPTPRINVCPRIHVNVPRMPMIKVPVAPVVHIDVPGSGTV